MFSERLAMSWLVLDSLGRGKGNQSRADRSGLVTNSEDQFEDVATCGT